MPRKSWLKSVTARKMIVHQLNDASIEGLLVGTYQDGLLLRSAALLNSGSTPTTMAGEVFIPREQVALIQIDG